MYSGTSSKPKIRYRHYIFITKNLGNFICSYLLQLNKKLPYFWNKWWGVQVKCMYSGNYCLLFLEIKRFFRFEFLFFDILVFSKNKIGIWKKYILPIFCDLKSINWIYKVKWLPFIFWIKYNINSCSCFCILIIFFNNSIPKMIFFFVCRWISSQCLKFNHMNKSKS